MLQFKQPGTIRQYLSTLKSGHPILPEYLWHFLTSYLAAHQATPLKPSVTNSKADAASATPVAIFPSSGGSAG